MHVPHTTQHGSLILREPKVPEAPGMHTQLLPEEVTHLEHTKPRQKWVRMEATPLPRNQASKPLLVAQQPCH